MKSTIFQNFVYVVIFFNKVIYVTKYSVQLVLYGYQQTEIYLLRNSRLMKLLGAQGYLAHCFLATENKVIPLNFLVSIFGPFLWVTLLFHSYFCYPCNLQWSFLCLLAVSQFHLDSLFYTLLKWQLFCLSFLYTSPFCLVERQRIRFLISYLSIVSGCNFQFDIHIICTSFIAVYCKQLNRFTFSFFKILSNGVCVKFYRSSRITKFLPKYVLVRVVFQVMHIFIELIFINIVWNRWKTFILDCTSGADDKFITCHFFILF